MFIVFFKKTKSKLAVTTYFSARQWWVDKLSSDSYCGKRTHSGGVNIDLSNFCCSACNCLRGSDDVCRPLNVLSPGPNQILKCRSETQRCAMASNLVDRE